jgi:hypothetical protein
VNAHSCCAPPNKSKRVDLGKPTNEREKEKKKSGGENEEEKTGNEMSFGVCVCVRESTAEIAHTVRKSSRL